MMRLMTGLLMKAMYLLSLKCNNCKKGYTKLIDFEMG